MRTQAVFERRPMATAAEGRFNDHWRHRVGRVFGHRTRAGLAGPAAIKGRRRRRQRPVRRRVDFETTIAGLLAVFGEVAGHVIGRRQQQRLVDHDRRHLARPVEAEFAHHHAPRRIDAVDDHRHVRPAGNDDLRLALRQSRRSHHSKGQSHLDKTHKQPAIGAKTFTDCRQGDRRIRLKPGRYAP